MAPMEARTSRIPSTMTVIVPPSRMICISRYEQVVGATEVEGMDWVLVIFADVTLEMSVDVAIVVISS
jgi:hypothetical protein